jgi:hypothetical protein
MKGFSSGSSSYINTTQEGASKKGIAMVSYAYNPKTGQVRGNKAGAIAGATVTTSDNSKNWILYNKDAMNGAIQSITITQSASDAQFNGKLYVALGTKSQGDVTSVSGLKVCDSVTNKEITFNIDPSKGYTYFKLLTNAKFTSGAVSNVVVKVTYVD